MANRSASVGCAVADVAVAVDVDPVDVDARVSAGPFSNLHVASARALALALAWMLAWGQADTGVGTGVGTGVERHHHVCDGVVVIIDAACACRREIRQCEIRQSRHTGGEAAQGVCTYIILNPVVSALTAVPPIGALTETSQYSGGGLPVSCILVTRPPFGKSAAGTLQPGRVLSKT